MTTLTMAQKIQALLDAGRTYKAIAEAAGCDTSTIYRVLTGAIVNPRYSVGTAIDEMHTGISKAKKKVAA